MQDTAVDTEIYTAIAIEFREATGYLPRKKPGLDYESSTGVS